MEEGTALCSVLLVGENPSDTLVLQHAINEARPDAPVTVARHHQDVARTLTACGMSTLRAAVVIPSSLEDAELLTLLRSAPGGGTTRIVVLLRDEFADQTRPFYLRGACSVVAWPHELEDKERLARRLVEYWEEINLPCSSAVVEHRDRQVSVI